METPRTQTIHFLPAQPVDSRDVSSFLATFAFFEHQQEHYEAARLGILFRYSQQLHQEQ
jgi:hypothetical protein